MTQYTKPIGRAGLGGDIEWCGRWRGGKHCLLCRHYAEFEDWSKNWRFFYLLSWYDENFNYGYKNREFAHFNHNHWYISWGHGGIPTQWENPAMKIKPKRYRTFGLKQRHLESLLKTGCKVGRKCKCVSVAQRGNWYCPECWIIMEKMARYKVVHIHDLMVSDWEDLKSEMLILRLSGAL